MVTVTGYKKRQAKDGKEFITLDLMGGLAMVQSQQTGKFYATVRRCSMSSTFDEEIAKHLIGSKIGGQIVRVQSEPYEYTVEGTGEIISLAHRWQFLPEGAATIPQMQEVETA